MGLMFSPVSGALSSKNTGGRSGLQRENTGTSFHNHNIGTAKCCPSETTKFPHMWGLQLNRDEAQQPSGKLIDVFISKVGSSPGGQHIQHWPRFVFFQIFFYSMILFQHLSV